MGRKEREAEAEPSLTRRRERLSDTAGSIHGVDHTTRGGAFTTIHFHDYSEGATITGEEMTPTHKNEKTYNLSKTTNIILKHKLSDKVLTT